MADARLGAARRRRRGVGAPHRLRSGSWSGGTATARTAISTTTTGMTTSHDHDHGHDHGHEHVHHHHDDTTSEDDKALTVAGILGVGVAAGLLPCPSALVVLLIGDRAPSGRLRLGADRRVQPRPCAARSPASASSRCWRRRAFGRVSFEGRGRRRRSRRLSALVILCVGVAITVRAFPA